MLRVLACRSQTGRATAAASSERARTSRAATLRGINKPRDETKENKDLDTFQVYLQLGTLVIELDLPVSDRRGLFATWFFCAFGSLFSQTRAFTG